MTSSCYLVDDVDKLTNSQQENVFHIFNHIKANGGRLLVSSAVPIQQAELIPELKSRLLTLPQYHMEVPATEALQMLCVKLLSDRQLLVEPKVVNYLVSRAGRSVDMLQGLIDLLDKKSLTDKRKITTALVRDILQDKGSEHVS